MCILFLYHIVKIKKWVKTVVCVGFYCIITGLLKVKRTNIISYITKLELCIFLFWYIMIGMKKILITGITGLIGQYIKTPLLEKNYEIYATSKSHIDGVNTINIDLLDTNQIDKMFSNNKFDYLIHLAWGSLGGEAYKNEIHNKWKETSFHLFRKFYESGGIKAVGAGTCFEYIPKNTHIIETDNLGSDILYPQNKINLYNDLLDYTEKNNNNFAWGRIFYTYGKNEKPERLVAFIINKLKADEKVVIKTSHLIKDYIYAKDIANAFISLLESKVNGAVNISSGKPIKVGELAMEIAKFMGKESLIELHEEFTDQNLIMVGDNSKLVNEVGYNNFTPLSEALKDIITLHQ